MFSYTQKVLFKHCDPAGIVFYPRYFEIMNDVVEAFFDERLLYPFREVVLNNGVPTAQINATFSAPSRLGDILKLDLSITALGRSSMSLSLDTHCEGERRFSATSVLVYVDQLGQSTAWPAPIRKAIHHQMHGDNE